MKKKKFSMKRIFCLLLSGLMVLGGTMPSVYATEETMPPAYTVEGTYVNMKMVDSTNTALAVGGAQYTVYSDSACTKVVYTRHGNPAVFYTRDEAIMKTKGDGYYSNTCGINPGKYYLKETKAADGYALDSNIYPFTVELEHTKNNPLVIGENGNITGTPDTAYVNMKMVDSANTALAVGGAQYTVYSDSACTKMVYTKKGHPAVFYTRDEATMKTKGDGYYSNTCGLKPSKYYLKETKAADGYALDSNVYSFTAELEHTKNNPMVIGENGNITSTPDTAYVNMKMVDSVNTALAVGGAQYTVYSDSACTKMVYTKKGNPAVFYTRDEATMKTKGDGYYSNTCGLNPGKYYLKETKAATGYVLNSNVYSFTVRLYWTKNNPMVIGRDGSITGTTGTSDTYVNIKKIDATNTALTVGGVQYTVYTDAACTKRAYTRSGNYAVFTTRDVETAAMSRDGYYSNTCGLNPGTYYMKETKAAAGCALDSKIYRFTVTTEHTRKNPLVFSIY